MNRFLVAKQRCAFLRLVLLAAVFHAGPLSSARADVTPEGDVSPSNPSGWTSSTTGYVGSTAGGTLTVNGDSDLLSYVCSIGDSKNSTGAVTVEGSGSTWTNSFDVYIGNSGDGAISITNHGSISALVGHIGYNSGSTGIVAVDGSGSTWTSTSLDVGESGSGTLSITNSGSVNTSYNSIGANSGSRGVATVDGSGSTWTNNTLYVGDSGIGAVSIINRGSVSSGSGYLGFWSGAAGTVTVDGTGSTWTNISDLEVGYYGSGTLLITNGSTVSVTGTTVVSRFKGSTGAIGFGTNGGTLTTQTLFASPTQLTGAGTINCCGLVSDISLIFDSAHNLKQTIGLQQSGENVTVNVDLATTPTNNGDLGAGWKGAGSLTIQDGIKVTSFCGYLGYNSGSTGVATVTGTGSTWANNILYAGCSGSGALSITNRGSVSSNYGDLGYSSGSTGAVAVDGNGSVWTNQHGLSVGVSGSGTLSITGGGAVTAATVSLNSTSLLAIDVGRGSSLTIGGGAGTLTNGGAIRILAGADVPADADTYSPISAGSWGGAGTYQAIGGTWSATNRNFTASSAMAGTSSVPISLDRKLVQRVLIDDNGTGGTHWEMGASFLAAGTTSNIVFTATAANGTLLDLLKTAAGNHTVSNAWTFSTTGYTLDANDPIYFSLKVGPNLSTDDLELWGYDGTSWAAYVPTDFTYDGTYASFTATGLSGYAVVPEPGALILLAVGLTGLAAFARRKWKIS